MSLPPPEPFPEPPNVEDLPDGPKFLTLDIETMAAQAWVWGPLYDVGRVGLNQIIKHDRVITVGAKWLHQNKTIYLDEHDLGPEGLAREVRALLEKADYLITYNGQSFDHKHLNRLMLTHRVPAPATEPVHIDLMKVAKAKFRFLSNQLQNLVNELDVGSKMKHSGFDLWKEYDAGVTKAIRDMKRYCLHDVRITEQVFEIMREDGWLDHKLPRPGQVSNWGRDVCGHCGSGEYTLYGNQYNKVTTYSRYKCSNCGKVRKGALIK